VKESEFYSEMLGTPYCVIDQALHELVTAYLEALEDFDQAVCTGGVGPDGGALPANREERALIEKHAREIRILFNDLTWKLGYSMGQFCVERKRQQQERSRTNANRHRTGV